MVDNVPRGNISADTRSIGVNLSSLNITEKYGAEKKTIVYIMIANNNCAQNIVDKSKSSTSFF